MFERLIILLTLFFLLSISQGHTQVVGKKGQTYPIKENDAYEEILSKVKNHNWNKEFERMRKNLSKSYTVNFNLKKAKEDRVFYVDPTYTLEFDITDGKGNIIYPKGYTFNPLNYMKFPYILIFFNSTSITEIEWLKSQKELMNRWDVMLIATAGDVYKAQKILGKQVYMLLPEMIDRFKLNATPSMLYAKGNLLIVQEVGVYKNAKN